jgi:hypothetical protein
MLVALSSEIVTAYAASCVQLSKELGCSPTLVQVFGRETAYVDPLGIATDTNSDRLREAELKHGRFAMHGSPRPSIRSPSWRMDDIVAMFSILILLVQEWKMI